MALKSKKALKNERVISLRNGSRFLNKNKLNKIGVFKKITATF